MHRHVVRPEERARRQLLAARFGILAATIVATLAGIMLVPPIAAQRVIGQLLILVPLLVGLYVAGRSTRLVAITLAAVALASVLGVLAIVRNEPGLLAADSGLRVVVFGAIVFWVVREVLGEQRVSLDTILGAICAYVLIGFLFANVYLTIQHLDPSGLIEAGHPLDAFTDRSAIFYFSYVTLTTVAYGDITAATPLARLVAMTEGMVGQLYPTIFIARLVSLSISQRE